MRKVVIAVLGALILFGGALKAGFVVKEGDEFHHFGLRPLIKKENSPPFIHTANYIGEDAEHKSKLLVVSFWASWCKPCKKELPLLEEYYKKYHNKGLEIFAVCIDKDKEGIEKAVKFVNEHKLSYHVLLDSRHLVVRQLFDENVNLPAMLIVDSNLKIVRATSGYTEDFPEKLEALIRQKLGLTTAEAVNKNKQQAEKKSAKKPRKKHRKKRAKHKKSKVKTKKH